MRLLKVMFFVPALLVFTACPKAEPSLIEVGDHKMDHQTFENRLEQVRFLNPGLDRGAVAAGLIEGWVADIILAREGQEYSRQDLIAERERIAKNEKSARLYREVTRVYGDDREAFLNVGLRPDMSLRKLHAVYEEENAAEVKGREVAAAALTNVQEAGMSFAALATESTAVLGAFQITPDGSVFDNKGIRKQFLSPNKRSDAEAARRLWKLATASSDGTVLGIVLRTKDGYMLLKRLEEKDGNVRFQTALFEAPNFGDWLETKAKGTHVCINDDTLRFLYKKEAKNDLLNCSTP